ncbi:hypothetical protein H6G91_16685 [Nostoc muscorum FACHB-395]|nr:hypothetical protein [Desmonostoc muscorum FACHB-395]
MALYKDFPNLVHIVLDTTIGCFMVVVLCSHPKRSHPNHLYRVQAEIIYSMTFVTINSYE